jgi:hypothetical protein
MVETNGVPLLVVITETLAEVGDSPLDALVMHAAVHGWMEGHLSAPGHRLDSENEQTMPNPPFPNPADELLQRIVREALSRFSPGEEPAAITYAAALGWQAGRLTANECPGCSPPGHDHATPRAIRSGQATVEFTVHGQPTSGSPG